MQRLPQNGSIPYGHCMSTRPRFALIHLLLLSFVCTACAGPSESTVDEPNGEERVEDAGVDDTSQFVAESGGDSHMRLTGPIEQLAIGDLVELVPRGEWPGGDAERPAQAVLLVTSTSDGFADTLVLGQRGRLDLERLFGRVTEEPRLALSKSVTTVSGTEGELVRLDANVSEGVEAGDLFFVLGEASSEPARLGSRIIALVRVTDVLPGSTRAQVVHQMAPIEAGAIALFAQHATLDTERPEALILFLRTAPDVPIDDFNLPPAATAVIDYMAEFGFSNISIQSLDTYVDPAAYNAAEQAQDAAPDDGFGVLVFGHEREGDFLYNITTYGSSPSMATSVGILPGGLPLQTPDGVEGLSVQLAPSFLATAMTQRGDHAEVIYFLEYCLRMGRITGDVAFHAREHLALRFESIDRLTESFWLMNHDIATAQAAGNPYPELNALSIRQFLDRQARDYEAELIDLDDFLEAAEDVLPDESLLGERLERARVLARLQRYDEAEVQLADVLHQAQRQDSLRWEVSTMLARANVLSAQDRNAEAIAAVNSAMPNARVLGDSYPRYAHSLLAQFYAMDAAISGAPGVLDPEGRQAAQANLTVALEYTEADDGPYSRATTYELAANLHYMFDEVPQSVIRMRGAADLYAELDQFEDSARTLMQLGMLELRATNETADPRFLASAYQHLNDSARVYSAIDRGLDQAQALLAMGMVNLLMRNTQQGLAEFSRCVDLGQAWNDPATVAVAYERMAELYARDDAVDQAQRYLQSARLWAETFELHGLLMEINQLEERLRSAI